MTFFRTLLMPFGRRAILPPAERTLMIRKMEALRWVHEDGTSGSRLRNLH